MTERQFRFVISIFLLLGLYFDLRWAVISIIGVYLMEGVTNVRVPMVIAKLLPQRSSHITCDPGAISVAPRFSIDSEQVLRLIVGGLLLMSYEFYPETLWYLPWLLGFALLGAAITGICPCILGLKTWGFR